MPPLPFSGRLDVPLACLLVALRHESAGRRAVFRDDVARDVLAVLDRLDVPPECLDDLDTFEEEVDGALARLVAAGWVARRPAFHGAVRFAPGELAESAFAWIRSRLDGDPRRLQALLDLDREVTRRVLAEYRGTLHDERVPRRA